MPTTLISFLGTGPTDSKTGQPSRNYRTAHYHLNGQFIGETSFAAAALLDHLKIDNLILVGTVKSLWEEAYRVVAERAGVDSETSEARQNELFDRALDEELNYQTPPTDVPLEAFEGLLGPFGRAVVIPYGVGDDQLTLIFHTLAKVLEQLPPDSSIYLDITHSFRSVPMYSLAALEYLTVIRNNGQVKDIFYAMLELSREMDNRTPVVSLRSILDIQHWIRAGYALKKFGNGYDLAKLLEPTNAKLAATLKQLTDALKMNDLNTLQDLIGSLQSQEFETHRTKLGELVGYRAIEGFRKNFTETDHQSALQLRIATYHYHRQNYGMAYLVLVEAMITYMCERHHKNWRDLSDRKQAKGRLVKDAQWKDLYGGVNTIRKQVAHQLSLKKSDPKDAIQQLHDFLERTKTLIT